MRMFQMQIIPLLNVRCALVLLSMKPGTAHQALGAFQPGTCATTAKHKNSWQHSTRHKHCCMQQWNSWIALLTTPHHLTTITLSTASSNFEMLRGWITCWWDSQWLIGLDNAVADTPHTMCVWPSLTSLIELWGMTMDFGLTMVLHHVGWVLLVFLSNQRSLWVSCAENMGKGEFLPFYLYQ